MKINDQHVINQLKHIWEEFNRAYICENFVKRNQIMYGQLSRLETLIYLLDHSEE